MGYIKITRGNRYKGFEYKVQSWNDLETLTNDAQSMVKTILENIKTVTRNPKVTQSPDGLHNTHKISKKQAVTQQTEKIAGTLQ